MTPKLTEAQVTAQIKGWLEAQGWYGIRLQSGVVRGLTRGSYVTLGKPGLPDFIFVRFKGCPQHLFVEVKAQGKQLRDEQVQWFEFARVRKFAAVWADSLPGFIERYKELF